MSSFSNANVSSILLTRSVSTQNVLVSSINGFQYIPYQLVSTFSSVTVSSLLTTQSISTQQMFLSSINGIQYVPYQLKIKPELRSKIATILGPSGTPPVKMRSNEKEWDSKGRDWRLAKAKDIESRTDMDIEGWEDLRYRQLPKEAKNPNIFYAPSTADNIIKAILQVSPKSDILRWETNDDIFIFPRKLNPVVPGDETLEKILQTVMDNAGIKDSVIKKESIETLGKEKGKGKENIKIDPIDLPPLEDFQADLFEFEIEYLVTKKGLNYSHLKISPLKSKQTNKVILSISGFRNKNEREKTEAAINKIKTELLESDLKQHFQRRAGIIK
jgi:hypothetical protein